LALETFLKMLSSSPQPEISDVVEIPFMVHTFVVNARIFAPVPSFPSQSFVPKPQAAMDVPAGTSARIPANAAILAKFFKVPSWVYWSCADQAGNG